MLAARVTARESQVVLGLDPDPAALWPKAAAPGSPSSASSDSLSPLGSDSPSMAGPEATDAGDANSRAALAVLEHCRAVIDATAEACVAVKLQLARFELLGAAGWATLAAVAEYARECGLLVIADGKRGDIDITARAYAAALMGGGESPFGRIVGLGADLVTVNPLMGIDGLEPFLAAAREQGAGVLVLVRTSNPGAADLEDLELRDGGTVWERIAAIVGRLGADGLGETGLSDVGAVMGATVPGHLGRARELMPHAPFLLPGIGAQGGRVEELAPAFAPGVAGGLISASRSIVDAHRAVGGDPADAARAESQRLREAAWTVSMRARARG